MCNDNIFELTTKDFSHILDIDESTFHPEIIDSINTNKLRYKNLNKKDRDNVILSLLKRMDDNKFSPYGKKEKWNRGWQESLEEFVNSGFDIETLVPKFYHRGVPVRVYGDYVKSLDYDFEERLVKILRKIIYYTYLKDKKNIYDFGCGTGWYLMDFAKMDPLKNYYGLDWAEQSSEIIKHIKNNYHYNIQGQVFNMFSPDFNFNVEKDSVLLTVGSMEQLGSEFNPFLNFMLQKPFSLYIHVNSILEFYDPENILTDYLVYKTEVKRNYLNGYYNKLKQLENEGIIKILKMKKIPIGGLTTDGYSLTVWEKRL